MSGSTGPLSDAERVDARRFMGYTVYGSGNSGAGFSGYRYFQTYGEMEFRLTNIGPSELVVLRAKLAELSTLDAAIATAGNTMGTAQAAVWTRNKTEARDRKALFDDRRRELCGFMGVPPGPALGNGTLSLVV